MITPVVQRWRAGRASYRPAGEPIRTRDFEVAEILGDTEAKRFVLDHHYSASYPAARYRFGLYRAGALAGVAIFSQPLRNEVLTPLGGDVASGVELGRFVLLDEVPANGESWFLARCFECIRREGINGVISFSDPIARTSPSGSVTFPGHIGTIYQASNAVFAGRSTARTLRLLPAGNVFSARAAQKIRKQERGWRYAAAQLVEAGAPDVSGDPREWLRTWLPLTTRPLRHAGNYRYLFGLTPSAKRRLPQSLAYPKVAA